MANEPDPSAGDRAEAIRIRSVYGERDARPARNPAVADAYRLVNADRLSRMHTLLAAMAAVRPRILDVGCGTGLDLAYWRSHGWPPEALAGVDLVPERIDLARERCPGVDLRVTTGATLPFDAGAFDVATAVTVFSSIRDAAVRRQLFAEMGRVVRPGGSIFVYDFVLRNPRNADVVAMTSRRLEDLGGPPDDVVAMTPLIHAVALGTRLGGRATHLAMRLAPRTHRLARWRVAGNVTRGGAQGAGDIVER